MAIGLDFTGTIDGILVQMDILGEIVVEEEVDFFDMWVGCIFGIFLEEHLVLNDFLGVA
jgi:hypothetical protein